MDRAYSLNRNAEFIDGKIASALIGVTFFVIATALGAYVRIPISASPAPITLQTFFVILAGAVLGKRLGSFSQLGYVALGACGLPLFQGAGLGVLHLMGPTGGYLAGFVCAAWFIGRMVRSESSAKEILSIFIIGDFIIHACGAAWLMYLYKINILTGISIGILPFIPGEVVKVSLAYIIYSRISQRSKAIFSR